MEALSTGEKVLSNKKPAYKDMLYRLSIHGALDLYESNSCPMKFMWAIVILVALSFATIEIILTINTFLYSPILTTYAVVPKTELNFPSIYVCPMNVVDKVKIKNKPYNLVQQLVDFFGMANDLFDNDFMLAKLNKNFDAVQATIYSAPVPFPDSFREKSIVDTFRDVSINQEDFIKKCSFHRKPLPCQNITSILFDLDYGQCFLVNINASQKVQ